MLTVIDIFLSGFTQDFKLPQDFPLKQNYYGHLIKLSKQYFEDSITIFYENGP